MKSDILEYLKTFAEMQDTPLVPYAGFVEFLYKQAEANNDHMLVHAAHNDLQKVIPQLENLERQRQCVLLREAKWVKGIFIMQAAVEAIAKVYTAMENDPERNFPDEKSLGFKLPAGSYVTVNIKENFVELLNNPYSLELDIVKVLFPHEMGSIIVSREIIDKQLVKLGLQKVRQYLLNQQNIRLIYNRLLALFPGNKIAVKEMLNTITKSPSSAFQSLEEPNDFTFKFWTHLANLVLENLKSKTNKLAAEFSFCYGSYIVGFTIMCRKGNMQREKQKKIDLQKITQRLKKPPYAYTLQDIYGFIDKSGVPYIKKYSKKLIDGYLDEQAVYERDKLPNIIRLRSGSHEYFLSKELLLLFFIKQLSEAAKSIKEGLKGRWMQSIKNFAKDETLSDDLAFQVELERQVKNGFPLLYSLLQTKLLFMARQEVKIAENIKTIVMRCFDEKNQLRNIAVLLDLDRKSIYQELKYRLPLYYSVPLLHALVFFFHWITGRRRKKNKNITEAESLPAAPGRHSESPPAGSARAAKTGPAGGGQKPSLGEYKKAIRRLSESAALEGRSVDESLKLLAKKWNPLIDDQAKADLAEDVNSLIRDFMRKLRKGFRVKPPDAGRIHNLAMELANNKSLKEIKRKEYLIRYIELYMIKSLSKEA